MCVPLRGIFVPNSLNVAHYAAFIWHKSPTKWHAQLPESNFQTRSKASMPFLGIETSDTGMSVFAVLIGRNEKAKMNFILKNG